MGGRSGCSQAYREGVNAIYRMLRVARSLLYVFRSARKILDGYHASLETLCISNSVGSKRSWDFAASFSSMLLHSY